MQIQNLNKLLVMDIGTNFLSIINEVTIKVPLSIKAQEIICPCAFYFEYLIEKPLLSSG